MMDAVDTIVRTILRSPQIKNKIVLLCEGDFPNAQDQLHLSPQRYARYERLPDANFYKACVPRNWHNSRTPTFFNCGGRTQVLDVYQALHVVHLQDPANSYLDPEKLYAMLDLDIQKAALPEGYRWKDTEELHSELYDDGGVKARIDDGHRIWVTALVHKEAFFILPSTFSALMDGVRPYWNGALIDAKALHVVLARQIALDEDVLRHFDIVKARLARFHAGSQLACTDAANVANSWIDAARTADDDAYASQIKALLSVAKTKRL